MMAMDAGCSEHGHSFQRGTCTACNAAYMRHYLRRRRIEAPNKEVWSRARKRAQNRNLPFEISPDDVVIPSNCPVLGIPLITGQKRSGNSASLDRIIPERGYVPGNVRVISDRANRLKGRASLADIELRAEQCQPKQQDDYRKLAAYLEREELLSVASGDVGVPRLEQWRKIAGLLRQMCIHGVQPPR